MAISKYDDKYKDNYDALLNTNPAELTEINHILVRALQEKHGDVTEYLDGLSPTDRAKLYMTHEGRKAELLNLDNAHLNGRHVDRSDFRHARFRGANFHQAHIPGVNLIGADLRQAENFHTITDKKDYNHVIFSRSTQIPENSSDKIFDKSPEWAVKLLEAAKNSRDGYAQWINDHPDKLSKEKAEKFLDIPCFKAKLTADERRLAREVQRRARWEAARDSLPWNEMSKEGQNWLDRMNAGVAAENKGEITP